jgi:hypothetical protein
MNKREIKKKTIKYKNKGENMAQKLGRQPRAKKTALKIYCYFDSALN